jgi:hypothetical protein
MLALVRRILGRCLRCSQKLGELAPRHHAYCQRCWLGYEWPRHCYERILRADKERERGGDHGHNGKDQA